MDGEHESSYRGAETTGFQSPAQDYVEGLIDLQRILDLRKPGIYPFRVKGEDMRERGIHDGDILIADTALRPSAGRVAVAILHGSFKLAALERRNGEWFLRPSGTKEALPVGDDVEVWAVISGLVRETV